MEAKNGESRDEQTTLTDVGCVISRTGLCDHGCICYCWYRLNSKVTLTHDTCHIVLSEMAHSCDECHKEEKFKETVICSQLITSCRDIQFLTNKLWRHFGEHQLGHFVQTDGYDPHNPFGDYLWKIFGYARIGKVYAEELNLIK